MNNVVLQAAVKNVDPSITLSYLWTITPQAGQSLVGTINQNGGTGRTLPDSNGNTSVCSSSSSWSYSNNAAQFQALTIPTTDTVTVAIYQGANCAAAMLLTNTATATNTNNANPTVVIAPPMPQIEASENVALTAKFNNPKAITQPASAAGCGP